MVYGQMQERVYLQFFRSKSGWFDACFFSPRSGWILHTVSGLSVEAARRLAYRDARAHGFVIVKEFNA